MTSPTMVYAQSSDIKSRSFLEYRRDMKKKAIAELEFLPVLQSILDGKCKDPDLKVQKHGVDARLWFNRNGKITREPDYQAKSQDRTFLYEFQYAEDISKLKFFDFKLSKVGKKKRGESRVPHSDREFFYVIKPKGYAFISPEWIMENGEEGTVAAWGNRSAYRVQHNTFIKKIKCDCVAVSEAVNIINDKNLLLEFQYNFLDIEADKLSHCLQQVIDSKKLLEIIPSTLRGIYETCFLLDRMDKVPDNACEWLVHLLTFDHESMSALELAQFMFALDFLYFKCGKLSSEEQDAFVKTLKSIQKIIREYPFCDGWLTKNIGENPAEESRQILFAANLLEDLLQDVAVNFDKNVDDIKKIFETVPHVHEIAESIRKNTS